MTRWSYKPTYFGPKNVPASVFGEELARLEEGGPITARRIVDAARPLDSPLHPELEWDDKVAGEAYRVGQARGWIRSLEVIIESSVQDEPREIFPAFVHVPSGRYHEEGTYVMPERLVLAPSQYERALEEALRRLESAEKAVHFLRRLVEGKGEPVTARVSAIHEAFHIIRDELESLRAS